MRFDEDSLIEKYLTNSISEEELLLFQKRMTEDALFFDKVQLEKQLYESLDDNDWSLAISKDSKELQEYKTLFQNGKTKEIKESIQEGYNLYKKENRTKKIKQILYSCAAAVILFISVFSLVNSEATHTELYSNYIDFSELPTLSTRSESNTEKLLEAERLFENKEYEKVINILDNDSNTSQKSLATQSLYLGISYMELNQFELAQKTFDDLSDSDLIDGRMGIWYKALLYIKMEDVDQAKTVLNEIVSNKLYNHKKANNLLQELD